MRCLFVLQSFLETLCSRQNKTHCLLLRWSISRSLKIQSQSTSDHGILSRNFYWWRLSGGDYKLMEPYRTITCSVLMCVCVCVYTHTNTELTYFKFEFLIKENWEKFLAKQLSLLTETIAHYSLLYLVILVKLKPACNACNCINWILSTFITFFNQVTMLII